jgi:hypothetical protein
MSIVSKCNPKSPPKCHDTKDTTAQIIAKIGAKISADRKGERNATGADEANGMKKLSAGDAGSSFIKTIKAFALNGDEAGLQKYVNSNSSNKHLAKTLSVAMDSYARLAKGAKEFKANYDALKDEVNKAVKLFGQPGKEKEYQASFDTISSMASKLESHIKKDSIFAEVVSLQQIQAEKDRALSGPPPKAVGLDIAKITRH